MEIKNFYYGKNCRDTMHMAIINNQRNICKPFIYILPWRGLYLQKYLQNIKTVQFTELVHPKRDGTKPWYCPNLSGYLSLMAQTQQLGITLLTPTPRRPWCHRIYCLRQHIFSRGCNLHQWGGRGHLACTAGPSVTPARPTLIGGNPKIMHKSIYRQIIQI